ncbi:MAG: hypothetical protein A2Y17_02835 [Clostridiales bacterium GWF2_38_85]|nr:MAG: hypothetical protein A2Y17_02835 [Clostridiales bacterium GWF2_38_85]
MNENSENINSEFYNENYFNSPKKVLIIFIAFIITIILFYFIATIFISYGYREAMNATYFQSINTSGDNINNTLIIIDPGHGGEDRGAIANGLAEKDLNLAVAMKLNQFFILSGYTVIMTRTDDVLLYKEGQEDRKKFYDLRNRLEIAEKYENCIFISIHMNKFPLQSSHGLQVFYSDNDESSQVLAEMIQNESKLLDPTNTRKIKHDNNTIYILEKITKPAVLVECGFISNYEESRLLVDEQYQNKLAFILFCGITKFMNKTEISER